MPEDFVIIKVKPWNTFSSLADTYLDDPSKGWVIAQFNNTETLSAGQDIVIPLKPLAKGGLTWDGYQTVPVLTYHRFSEERGSENIVSRVAFETQMNFLKENGYNVITPGQLLPFLNFRTQLYEKSVLITIDGGWKSFYDIAFPILKKYDFPFTLFVNADFIGSKDALTWKQAEELAIEGVDIQCQIRDMGISESDKSGFRDYFESLEKKISGSAELIYDNLHIKCQYMAYTPGKMNNLFIELLKKKGYLGGFAVSGESNPFFVNNYRIHRFAVYGEDDIEAFKRKLAVFRKEELK